MHNANRWEPQDQNTWPVLHSSRRYKGAVGVSDYGISLFTIGLPKIDATTGTRYKDIRGAIKRKTILDRCRRTSLYTNIQKTRCPKRQMSGTRDVHTPIRSVLVQATDPKSEFEGRCLIDKKRRWRGEVEMLKVLSCLLFP